MEGGVLIEMAGGGLVWMSVGEKVRSSVGVEKLVGEECWETD